MGELTQRKIDRWAVSKGTSMKDIFLGDRRSAERRAMAARLNIFNTVWEGRRSIDRAPFIEPVRKAKPIRREGKVGYGRLFMATAAGFIPVRLRYSSRHST